MSTKYIEIIKPDDWHVHLREDHILRRVLPFTYDNFKRALVMPNLSTPLTSIRQVMAYYKKIRSFIPPKINFDPLMTLYLSKDIDKNTIKDISTSSIIKAIKMYPKGATTNSEFGISNFKSYYNTFEAMEKYGVVLSIHGEVTDENIDVFDREKAFVDTILSDVTRVFPNLKIVLEHISAKESVEFITTGSDFIGATITLHHLLINRNNLLSQKIRPHFYCAPILKTEKDRKVLVEAAISGNRKFFLGTDSAPHFDKDKLSPCGCAGVFSSPVAMPYLVQLFNNLGKLEQLEKFTSINGALFYGQTIEGKKIKYVPTRIPRRNFNKLKIINQKLSVFNPGIDLLWEVKNSESHQIKV